MIPENVLGCEVYMPFWRKRKRGRGPGPQADNLQVDEKKQMRGKQILYRQP